VAWTCRTILAIAAVGAIVAADAAPAAGNHYTVAYRFKGGADGQGPVGGLIDVGGVLYGTTFGGAAYGDGSVFSLDPNSGAEKIVYAFGAYQGDGQYPAGALLEVDGAVFGTTSTGGHANSGTVFSLDLTTGAETVVHSFAGGSDGAGPLGNLISIDGMLYGTTQAGGSTTNCGAGCGTVFSLNPTTGVNTVVYDFKGGNDGANPQASLLEVGGKLYGTTKYGGAGYGVVFSLDPKTGREKIEYSFAGGGDGAYPLGSLIKGGAALYGTTNEGGSHSSGAVFSFTPKSGAEQVLYSFQNGQNDGAYPTGSLILVNGLLYGTASGGGVGQCYFSCGEVFSVDPGASGEQIEHFFQGGRDGGKPAADLVNVGGRLYGTTSQGGDSTNCNTGCGAVFAFKP